MKIDIAAGQKDAECSKKYGGDEHDRRQNERELSLRLFNMIKPNETFFLVRLRRYVTDGIRIASVALPVTIDSRFAVAFLRRLFMTP